MKLEELQKIVDARQTMKSYVVPELEYDSYVIEYKEDALFWHTLVNHIDEIMDVLWAAKKYYDPENASQIIVDLTTALDKLERK